MLLTAWVKNSGQMWTTHALSPHLSWFSLSILSLTQIKENLLPVLTLYQSICLETLSKPVKHLKQYSNSCGRPNTEASQAVAYPGIFFRGGSTNSVEDRGQRERGSGGGSPLVRGSGCSCN